MAEYPTKYVNPALIKYYLQSSLKILHNDERRGDDTHHAKPGAEEEADKFRPCGYQQSSIIVGAFVKIL